jgi:hypothetical protein
MDYIDTSLTVGFCFLANSCPVGQGIIILIIIIIMVIIIIIKYTLFIEINLLDMRILLKWICGQWDGETWTRLVSFRTGTAEECL